MENKKRYEICRADLEAHLSKIGVSSSQASEEMGFSKNYLGVAYKRGYLHPYAVRLIKARFGLDYEQYKKHEPPKVEEPKPRQEEVAENYTQDLILEELRAIRSLLQSMTEAVL